MNGGTKAANNVEGEIDMATKNKKNSTKAAAPKAPRKTIKAAMLQIFTMAKVPSDLQIEQRIRRAFPKSAFTAEVHVPYYRHKYLNGVWTDGVAPSAADFAKRCPTYERNTKRVLKRKERATKPKAARKPKAAKAAKPSNEEAAA